MFYLMYFRKLLVYFTLSLNSNMVLIVLVIQVSLYVSSFMVAKSLENLEKSGNEICDREKLEKSVNLLKEPKIFFVYVYHWRQCLFMWKPPLRTSKLLKCFLNVSGNYWKSCLENLKKSEKKHSCQVSIAIGWFFLLNTY